MNYLADSTAKLCQGGKGRYVDREGVPVDNCSREKCDIFLFGPKMGPRFLAGCFRRFTTKLATGMTLDGSPLTSLQT